MITKDRFKIKHEPSLNYQGHWVIYENIGGDWWVPITSRSSQESGDAYISQRLAMFPAVSPRGWLATLLLGPRESS